MFTTPCLNGALLMSTLCSLPPHCFRNPEVCGYASGLSTVVLLLVLDPLEAEGQGGREAAKLRRPGQQLRVNCGNVDNASGEGNHSG